MRPHCEATGYSFLIESLTPCGQVSPLFANRLTHIERLDILQSVGTWKFGSQLSDGRVVPCLGFWLHDVMFLQVI
eukprot:3595438-Amphidinium_carterae.1